MNAIYTIKGSIINILGSKNNKSLSTIEKWTKYTDSTKRIEIYMSLNYKKMFCFAHNKKLQIKTTLRSHFSHIELAKIQKFGNILCG